MVIVCILSISAISATENTANKEITNTEINQETNIQYDDVSTSNMNDELNLEENNGRNEESRFRTDKTTTTNEDPLTFTDLNTTINDNDNSTIYLMIMIILRYIYPTTTNIIMILMINL